VYEIPDGYMLRVPTGDSVDVGEILAELDEDNIITAKHAGRVVQDDNGLRVVWERREEGEYEIPAGTRLLYNDGDTIGAGDQLTEGSKNPHRILDVLGRDAVTTYLLREMQKVYRPQGQNINDKHFEVIIRKMLGKVEVTNSGDTELLPGDLIEAGKFNKINEEITEEGGEPARAKPVLLGITKAALNTESFLSSASFQHTIKVLAGAAIAGKEDQLIGLKENVIIGKLIPAGTGYRHKEEDIEDIDFDTDVEDLLGEDDEFASLLIGDDTPDEVLAQLEAQQAAETLLEEGAVEATE
jgi:DNA-directed RNA polymerase subunit beta'